MLDALKNLGNMGQVMAKAREMQGRMAAIQEELGRRTVEADAGAGMVTATVNGKLELVRLKIDPTRFGVADAAGKLPMTAGDFEMLEDLIAAAVRAAQAKAADMLKDEMQRMAGEMGLPPGMLPGS